MGIIRQYLKQKVARTFSGRKVDLDVVKKEIKDELTHVLYDQTRRTPIVIPVINEIGGGGGNKSGGEGGGEGRRPNNGNRGGQNRGPRQQQGQGNQGENQRDDRQSQPAAAQGGEAPFKRPAPKKFPAPVVPDTEAVEPKAKQDQRGY
jgi:hypothetical protein